VRGRVLPREQHRHDVAEDLGLVVAAVAVLLAEHRFEKVLRLGLELRAPPHPLPRLRDELRDGAVERGDLPEDGATSSTETAR
jgi:hypothetical protein